MRLSRASAYCAVSEAWMATAKRAGDRASSVKAIRRDPATARVVALVDVDGLDMADGDMFRLFEH